MRRLLDAKGRDRTAPPPVLVPGIPTLEALADPVPDEVRALVDEFWPGGLTVILRARSMLDWDLGDTRGTVALRMPRDPIALELLAETGPLAVSSANRTGEPAALTAAEAERMLGDAVAIYLDAGTAGEAYPDAEAHAGSTIVDATNLEHPEGTLAHRAPRRHPGRGDHPGGRGRAMRLIYYVPTAGIAAIVAFALSMVIWKLSHEVPALPEDPRARRAHPPDAAPRRRRHVPRASPSRSASDRCFRRWRSSTRSRCTSGGCSARR